MIVRFQVLTAKYEDDSFLGYGTMQSRMIALMMRTVRTSENFVYYMRLLAAISQKGVICILMIVALLVSKINFL
jgi:hypothetical protein